MNRTEYFDWLVDQVNGGRYRRGTLLSILFDTEFRWSYRFPTDANRAADGQFLRTQYANETKDYLLYGDAKEPCNVLEMLVALAIRIETDIMGEPGNDHPEHWFWEMIKNLGLLPMTDKSLQKEHDVEKVMKILNKFMDREYDNQAGVGGLFPVYSPRRDQSLLPIWEQMNDYLNENY